MSSPLRILLGLAILTGIYLVAQWAVTRLGIPFPGGLAGLLLCFVLLRVRLLRVEWLQGATDLLLSNLALFHLPFLAALGQYWPLLQASGLPLVAVLIATTGLVVLTTGLVAERLGDRAEEQDHVAIHR